MSTATEEAAGSRDSQTGSNPLIMEPLRLVQGLICTEVAGQGLDG